MRRAYTHTATRDRAPAARTLARRAGCALALLSCRSARAADCWCIDVCDAAGAHRFVARTRDVHLGRSRPGAAKWMDYFEAVYAGRVPEPFDLARVNYVYHNSATWRSQHRDAPNPFRDCSNSTQPECGNARCGDEWYQPLQRHPRALPFNVSVRLERVHSKWRKLGYFPEGLAGALIVSSGAMGYGHTVHSHGDFVEIMRHNNLRWNWPGTEEGVRVDLLRAKLARTLVRERRPLLLDADSATAEERIKSNLTARVVGCWARPAAGSGIWVRAARVLAFEHASDAFRLVGNETVSVTGASTGMQRVRAALAWEDDAIGVDGVAIQLADGTERWPVFVITSAPCTTRDRGIGNCLPSSLEVRTGWHDVPCACNATWMQLNCAG